MPKEMNIGMKEKIITKETDHPVLKQVASRDRAIGIPGEELPRKAFSIFQFHPPSDYYWPSQKKFPDVDLRTCVLRASLVAHHTDYISQLAHILHIVL